MLAASTARRPDVLMPNAPGFFSNGGKEAFAIYANDGQAHMTDVSQAAVGGYEGQLRQVAVGDVDGDGDLDIYGPEAFGALDHFWINDGSGAFTDEAATRMPAGLGSHAGGAVRRLRQRRRLDCCGDGYGKNRRVAAHLYLNDGTGKYRDATATFPWATRQRPRRHDLLDVYRDLDASTSHQLAQRQSNLC